MSNTCGHCGQRQLGALNHYDRGGATADGTPLCHPDFGMECYRLVTVYHHPTPCPECEVKNAITAPAWQKGHGHDHHAQHF